MGRLNKTTEGVFVNIVGTSKERSTYDQFITRSNGSDPDQPGGYCLADFVTEYSNKVSKHKVDFQQLSELEVINKEFGTLPNHIRILNPDCGISTLSLFEFIDIGITVRGTAGMELPCFGKTTLTAGTGRYSQLGFTNDSDTKVEYLNKLRNIENLPNMTEDQIILAKKHAFISFYSRGWKMETYKSNFLKIEKGSHPLDHDLMLNKNNNEYRDLKLFTNWVESDNVDYFDLNSLVI